MADTVEIRDGKLPVVSPGTYMCRNCGDLTIIESRERLYPCHICGGRTFDVLDD